MSEHTILRTWVRTDEGGVPEERPGLTLVTGEGVDGDHTRGGRRHVTLVFEDDWNAAASELGREVDPVGRRANVLLSGGGAGAWIGKTVRLGRTTLEIQGETRPCPIMNNAADGMEDALRPDCRAGVWGVVVEGGDIAPGDRLAAL